MILTTQLSKSENDDVLNSLAIIVIDTLSERQKHILLSLLEKQESVSATKFIQNVLIGADCSQSTLWNTLRCLKKQGLVDFANGTGSIQLTNVGKIIGEKVKNDSK
ncbi:MAG: hypothetical protein WC595_04405 [Candidatus Nanoarchaeia archaeon]